MSSPKMAKKLISPLAMMKISASFSSWDARPWEYGREEEMQFHLSNSSGTEP